MGVVFAVVNGICMDGLMCYYDRNKSANRAMAVLLIIEHCVCILLSVILAKRAHVIDAGLKSDVSIRLNQPMIFYKKSSGDLQANKSKDSRKQVPPAAVSTSDESRRQSMDTPDLQHVQTDHEGKVMSTIEISAKRRKFRKKRSKSNPNLKRIGLTPEDLDDDEDVFSIFSDSEMKDSKERRRSKIKVFRVKNRVSVINKKPNTSTDEERHEVQIVQTTTVSVKSSGTVMQVKSVSPDDDTTTNDDTYTESPPPYESVIQGDTTKVDM